MLTETFNVNGYAVQSYFHDWYYTMRDPRNTMHFITNLKNDIPPYHSSAVLSQSEQLLTQVLRSDFEEIVSQHGPLTVCGVPRSKRESSYWPSQMGLKRTIRAVAWNTPNLCDGMDFIIRHTDTVCTHRARSGHGGAGELPRPGLIRDTCWLSLCISGKRILLVDDIYTPGVGIDEDAIATLLDCGATHVVFYAVGYTARHRGFYSFCA